MPELITSLCAYGFEHPHQLCRPSQDESAGGIFNAVYRMIDPIATTPDSDFVWCHASILLNARQLERLILPRVITLSVK